MSLLTTIYKFIKPELTDSPPDITVMNQNWDRLDAKLKEIEDTDAAHKADTMPHRFTDTITSKTYKWGLKVANGLVSIIYEEVV